MSSKHIPTSSESTQNQLSPSTVLLGATGGVGSALAPLLADALLSGRNESRLAALAGATGASYRAADLGFESQVARLFAGVSGVQTLIYAAGSAYPQPLLESDPSKVREVWNANYFGLLWTLKYGLPTLTPDARVYVLGARPELITVAGFTQYAAAKAAAARLLEVTRAELRRDKKLSGVRLTLVLPPAIDTALWQQVGRVPRGAMSPEAVAQAIVADHSAQGADELLIDLN